MTDWLATQRTPRAPLTSGGGGGAAKQDRRPGQALCPALRRSGSRGPPTSPEGVGSGQGNGVCACVPPDLRAPSVLFGWGGGGGLRPQGEGGLMGRGGGDAQCRTGTHPDSPSPAAAPRWTRGHINHHSPEHSPSAGGGAHRPLTPSCPPAPVPLPGLPSPPPPTHPLPLSLGTLCQRSPRDCPCPTAPCRVRTAEGSGPSPLAGHTTVSRQGPDPGGRWGALRRAVTGVSCARPPPQAPTTCAPCVRGTRAVVHRPRDMTREVWGAEAGVWAWGMGRVCVCGHCTAPVPDGGCGGVCGPGSNDRGPETTCTAPP